MAEQISVAEFRAYLRSGLESRGWSVYRLAKELKVSQTQVATLARGEPRAPASEATLRRIADALGLDEEWLVIQSGALFGEGSIRRRVSELLLENRRLRIALTGGELEEVNCE